MLFLISLIALLLPQPASAISPVVSTEWLATHLRDPNVSVVDTSARARYARGHITGARLVEHEMTLGGDHRLLPVADLAKVLARAGGGDGQHVVLYGDQPMSTGWIYMAFTALGQAGRVSMLDGNLASWTNEGRPVETIEPPAVPGTLTPGRSDAIVDATYVRDRLEKPGTCLIDARTTREVGGGRLPGSTLMLWQDLFVEPSANRFKSPEAIRAMFVAAGYTPGDEIVTYCAIGMRASLMFFAARYAGLPAKVYVGSHQDWQQRPGFPIVR